MGEEKARRKLTNERPNDRGLGRFITWAEAEEIRLLLDHYRDQAMHLATDTGAAEAYQSGRREGMEEMKHRMARAADAKAPHWVTWAELAEAVDAMLEAVGADP